MEKKDNFHISYQLSTNHKIKLRKISGQEKEPFNRNIKMACTSAVKQRKRNLKVTSSNSAIAKLFSGFICPLKSIKNKK